MADGEKKASREGRIIVCIDEAGFYLLPGRVKSYAPQGHTPILKPLVTYAHRSVMSGITPAGQLYTLVRDEALDSFDSVSFLMHLLALLKKKLLVIWDGSPIHRKEVLRFMEQEGKRYIHLECFPPYAPELNPDEGVWQHLKHVELRNVSCQDLPQLRAELNRAIIRLRSKPHRVRSFFAGAKLQL
jgi:transposase